MIIVVPVSRHEPENSVRLIEAGELAASDISQSKTPG